MEPPKTPEEAAQRQVMEIEAQGRWLKAEATRTEEARRERNEHRADMLEVLGRIANMLEARELRDFGHILDKWEPGQATGYALAAERRMRPLLSVQEQVAATPETRSARDGGEAASVEAKTLEQLRDLFLLCRDDSWAAAERHPDTYERNRARGGVWEEAAETVERHLDDR